MIGRALGSYRVVEKLGAGGMGEVYRARDERLGRDVALKLLPEGRLGDEAARSRFRKEAQALLLLSHPHVATLFDYGSADGVDYLAMELVPGPTLAETLRSGPLPAREVVKLGAQLARGLRAAHEQGIVHRDLKPSNLCLTSDGLLKVLDFGLARLAPEAVRAGGEDTPTETAAGTVVGSPPYMSPEQLLGKEVDARSDVYSAGACLYELATGRRPFGERSGAALVDAILHEAPEALDFAGGDVPAGLQSVITKAMDKNPSLRYQTAAELLVDLERLQAAGSHALPASPQGAGMRRRPAAALLWAVPVVGVSVAALLIWSLRSPELPRVVDVRPLGLPLGGELGVAHGILSWATDGQRIYYVGPAPGGKAGLFQVSASGGDASELPLPFEYYLRIEGYMAREGALLMRGASAGDVERGEQPGEPPVDGVPMWVVPLPAGPARRLGLAGDGLAASPDGERFARVRGGRLAIVRIDGTVLRTLDTATNVRRAAWDTAGRRIRYFVGDPDVGRGQVWEWPVDGNGAPRLVEADASDVGRFTRYGRHFVFARANQRFPRRDLYVAREPRFPWSSQTQAVPLSSGPLDMWDAGPDPGSHRLLALGRAPRGELLRYEPQSSRFEPFLEGLSAHYVDPSPDGSWLAWTSFPETELWKSRADGSGRARLTPPGWWAVLARWSPDARSVSFVARRPDELTQGLFRVSPEGGEPQLLVPDPGGERIWDACWTPDGKAIVYSLYGKAGLRQVDVRSRSSTPFPGGESLAYPKCSRDGSILATSFSPGARGGDWLWSAVAQSWRRLGPSRIAYPSFAHDGRSIIGYNAVQRRIERRWLDTGRFEPVADLRGVPLAVLLDVPWMGLLPDDSPLVLRDRSTPDIYALDWERP